MTLQPRYTFTEMDPDVNLVQQQLYKLCSSGRRVPYLRSLLSLLRVPAVQYVSASLSQPGPTKTTPASAAAPLLPFPVPRRPGRAGQVVLHLFYSPLRICLIAIPDGSHQEERTRGFSCGPRNRKLLNFPLSVSGQGGRDTLMPTPATPATADLTTGLRSSRRTSRFPPWQAGPFSPRGSYGSR
jgi:hypothetical protein